MNSKNEVKEYNYSNSSGSANLQRMYSLTTMMNLNKTMEKSFLKQDPRAKLSQQASKTNEMKQMQEEMRPLLYKLKAIICEQLATSFPYLQNVMCQLTEAAG